jgi:hypothetical protein
VYWVSVWVSRFCFFVWRDLTTCCSVGDGNVWIAAARLLACFDFEEVEVCEIEAVIYWA